jgi:outer membrane protein assembly factor BamE (lipoprotein component of BamABCDE complex)
MAWQKTLGIVGSCLLTSCFTIGKPFKSDLSWMRKESTQKKDVKFILGDPTQVGQANGVETWTYSYHKYQLFQGVQSKELKIYWKKDAALDRYTFSSSFPKDIETQR